MPPPLISGSQIQHLMILKKYHFEALIRKSSNAVFRTQLLRRGGGWYYKGKTTIRVNAPPPNFWITDTAFDELRKSIALLDL